LGGASPDEPPVQPKVGIKRAAKHLWSLSGGISYDKTQKSRRHTSSEESKPTGGKVTIRRDLIERGGSSEAWYGAGERNRTSNQRFTKPLLCH
jgi:hypothetical protein